MNTGWLGDVDVPGIDELGELTEEEGQEQRADVGSVHVRVGHDDELVIAQLGDVEIVLHARPERGDEVADLFVAQDLVDARLLDVQDLAPDRHDRLEAAIAPLLRGAPGRIALDDEQLAVLGVVPRTVCQFSRQRPALEDALAARQLARLARRLARRSGHLLDDLPPPAGSPRRTPAGLADDASTMLNRCSEPV
jgi:hypothetical protein